MRHVGPVVVLLCALMVVFTFMPTGTSGNDIVAAYHQQSVESITQSGILEPYYPDIEPGNDVTGVVQTGVESAATAASGFELKDGHIDFCWVTSDGTPVRDYSVSSTFPKRGGQRNPYADNTAGSGKWHLGTDACSATGDSQQIWQVALWSGEVVKAEKSDSYGYTVLIKVDGTNTFYVRYAHMGYGTGRYETDSGAIITSYPKAWESGMSGSSLKVQKGDHVNAGDVLGSYGTTGSSSGNHCHIELVLCPKGDGNTGDITCYRASVANILIHGKKLNEITWYNFYSKQAGAGKVLNFDDYWDSYEHGEGAGDSP